MSSSVLRNVIQPKNTSPFIVRADADSHGQPERPQEEMEAVLGVLVENAPVAMAMFDHQMRYVLANRAWVEEFSLQSVHPLMGRSQYEVFPGMHPGWKQVYDRALQGHVVRSEHDALSGPDGRRVVYRWEVRPWRRKRDASVGGLMVTCEKFGNASALPPQAAGEDSQPENAGQATPRQELVHSTLPMVLVDERGVIRQTNASAAELGLARGIREGESAFWDVFADTREASRLQLQWGLTMEKLAGECRQTGWVMELPLAGRGGENGAAPLSSQRWLVTLCQGEGERRYLALLLPAGTVAEAPRNAPANLPAIAQAVSAISQMPAADMSSGQSLEIRRLQEELARARQELRTLHEAERVFTQRESRMRQYLDSLPCGVLVLDELGSPAYQNDPLTKLLGRRIQKEETVEEWLAAACPTADHREEVATLWREDVWRRQLTRTFSLATADGLLKELEFQPSGLPGGGLLVCIQDATEHCRQEEQLRATEAKFRTLLQESPQAVVLMDKAGAVFEANHLAETLLGHPKNELRRYPLEAWLEPEHAAARRAALQKVLETGEKSAALNVTIRQTEGNSVPVELTLAPVLDVRGELNSTVHFLRQKSDFAQAPAVPAPSQPAVEAPSHAMLSAPPAPRFVKGEPVERLLLATNVNGRIKELSEHGSALLELASEEAKGRALHLYFRPSDPSGFYSYLASLAQSPDEAQEVTCFARSGERKSCRLKVRSSGGGGFDFALHEVVDTEVELPPEALEETAAPGLSASGTSWTAAGLAREKLLLGETHHRIKNHLQIISSLLNLESNNISDESARGVLRSSQNRVKAVAELHQHLYQFAVGQGESFASFAQGLVGRLRDCYQVPAERVEVTFHLQEGPVPQEWLMPLALTLNETLSNSFEHAFPQGRLGRVSVTLGFDAHGGFLRVADDGMGLPQLSDGTSFSGLGLKILAVFAEQMNGSLEMFRPESGGADICLRFRAGSEPSV
ncbi:MAG TPA: PAS domain-containing protein [Prosthecobacter sp.]